MARYRIFKHDNDTHPFAVFKFVAGPGANFWQQISKGYFYIGWALRFAKQRHLSLEGIEK